MDDGMYHYHRRKRIYKNHEPYPNPNKFKRFMDTAVYVVGVLGPLMTIPQIWEIWANQDASGVSLITWVSYLIFGFVWFIYGVIHNEKPIIFAYFAWTIMKVLIIMGIIFYG